MTKQSLPQGMADQRLCRFFTAALCSLLMILLWPTTVTAGQTFSYTSPQQAYSGSRERSYKVYVPTGLSTPAPMVMALHGCRQTNDDVLNDWGLKAAADRYGFILVAPFITSYDGLRNENCWGFWFEQHIHQGGGEVADLHRIAQQVEANFVIDANRRFITGLSSGGAMALVAAVAYNEYWAAAAPAAGLPYRETASSVSLSGQCPGSATFRSVSQVAADMRSEVNDAYPIPLMILQNRNDCTVLQTAANNMRDAHLQVFGSASRNTPATTKASDTGCSPYHQNDYGCRHIAYTQDSTTATRSLVETVIYDGPLATPNPQDTNHGHYWIGGAQGNNGKWSLQVGPSYPDIIWDFFSRHSRDGSQPQGHPVIVLQGDNPLSVPLGSTFNDPGASASDAEDGSLPVSADCSAVNPSVVGSYSCLYSATDSDGNRSTLTRTVEVYDPNAPVETCQVVSASPSAHIGAGRAYAGGTSNLRAYAKDDGVDIGGSFDTWSNVPLYEGEPGRWYAQRPAACGGSGQAFTCQEWNASNLSHVMAGRAYYGYYTVGGNQYLGSLSGLSTWVRETAQGHFQAGRCSN
ncbi:extracellular catalytic domain type 1 short-chain-length polyhydroxyalkanoate depolymerase [Ectopseudomonas guguanensis]|uniref:Esterase, PHB depolymerase family n=1 Tax=Ectopseudomonas guguanensis TaxID=1198456 RepID=A0A1H0TY28_9GAMM|nr:PHB depolymerase family esterase [Pseudomonas guguanensis]SDP58823.1 esterase, PHB depolymerase family [Pseudomonas guguanensis]